MPGGRRWRPVRLRAAIVLVALALLGLLAAVAVAASPRERQYEVTTEGPPEAPAPTPTARPPTGGLPFTGFQALVTFLAGALIGGTGVALRWAGQEEPGAGAGPVDPSEADERPADPAPRQVEDLRAESQFEHFLFVPAGNRYTMLARRGPAPPRQAELALSGFSGSFVVTRVLPLGRSFCAYLQPIDAGPIG